jgi:glycosyltransferase involved in cell wall biosynthesis
MSIDVTIVVPAYHESDRIEQSLKDLAKAIKEYLDPQSTEVIVVSADNADPTGDLAQGCAPLFEHFSVIRPGARVGKGRDTRLGILAGQGTYRMFMDADMATPLHHLEQVVVFMKTGGDMSIGIRPLASIHTGFRKVVSEFGNILVQTLLTPGISDSQCGFKVFRADVAETIFPRLTILGWGFDMELLTIARVHKIKIDTMNIPDWHDPKEDGLTGDSSLKVTIDTGVELLRILGNRLIRRYK